jgi:ABC-2 type transport system permease protein
MNKIWRVAVFEYQRNVFKKSFIFVLLSVPSIIAMSLIPGFLIERSRNKSSLPVGIVDLAGIVNPDRVRAVMESDSFSENGDPIFGILYEDVDAARAALQAGEIQAYFMLPEHYAQFRHVEVVYIEEPGNHAWHQFYDYIRISLLSEQPPEIIERVAFGIDFTVRSIDGKRKLPLDSGPTFGLLMPLFIAITFLFMLLLGSGYLMNAFSDEKENRTIEVLLTTMPSSHLVSGKILGIFSICITLILVWGTVMLLGVYVAHQAGFGWFSDLSMDWRPVLAAIAIALPSYLLATALVIAVSALLPTSQDGQVLSGIFFALHLAPVYLTAVFLNEPHSTLAVILSLLPFTSLMTISMRNLLTIVPTWQVLVSVIVQLVGALVATCLASRAFHIGMLNYHHCLDLARLLGRVRR